jgi:hypothetical protein
MVPRSPFLRRTIFRPALLILDKIVTIIALVGLGIAFVLWPLFALIFAARRSGL